MSEESERNLAFPLAFFIIWDGRGAGVRVPLLLTAEGLPPSPVLRAGRYYYYDHCAPAMFGDIWRASV